MSETNSCPKCQSPLSPHVAGGQCLRCLARLAEDDEAERRFEEPPGLREGLERELADYTLEECLGVGGMGVVYRAHHTRLDRPVAIKVLLPSNEEPELWRGRFEREARALARLSHAGVVGVHDFGRVGDHSWLVMEYVEGANLRQLFHEGRLEVREALTIAPQLCDALQYAHDEGVVHRDIKPENILMDMSGHVKIADFGLAKILGDSPSYLTLTGSRQAMGTFRYMSPEQIERPREVDHRADVFSLGVVLYEMLTGEVPVGRFEPPSKLASVDERVDHVVLRALERDPARRFQSVRELKRALLDAQGTADPERSLGERARAAQRVARREPVPADGGAIGRLRTSGTQVFAQLGIPEEANLLPFGLGLAGTIICVLPEALHGNGYEALVTSLPAGPILFFGFLVPLISLERAHWDHRSPRFLWSCIWGAALVGLGYGLFSSPKGERLSDRGEMYRLVHAGLAFALLIPAAWLLLRRRFGELFSRPLPSWVAKRFTLGVIGLTAVGIASLFLGWQVFGASLLRGFDTFHGVAATGALCATTLVRLLLRGTGLGRLTGLVTFFGGAVAVGMCSELLDNYRGVTSAPFVMIAIGAATMILGFVQLLFGVADESVEGASAARAG